MEFKPLRIEKSDQILLKSSDDHPQFSSHVRSYTCTFCKRGFSNAQALGGHMNIHRRDRAKLKESSGDRSLLPFDITKKSPSDDHDSSQPESSDEKICCPERPSVLSKGGDGVGEVQKLYLFVETPSSSNEEKKEQLSHGSSHAEVDLELRLGLEHHETTTK